MNSASRSRKLLTHVCDIGAVICLFATRSDTKGVLVQREMEKRRFPLV
jgi:hypothetical protein